MMLVMQIIEKGKSLYLQGVHPHDPRYRKILSL
jgi:hypothetical protein